MDSNGILLASVDNLVLMAAQPWVTIHSIIRGKYTGLIDTITTCFYSVDQENNDPLWDYECAGQAGFLWSRGRTAIDFSMSNPVDSLTLELHENGVVVHTITTMAQESPYEYPVGFTTPPPECYVCFLVARSNTYPEVYYKVNKLSLVISSVYLSTTD